MNGGIAFHGMAQARQHQQNRLFGDGTCVDTRVVAHRDAMFTCGFDVDDVVGDAFGMDQLQAAEAVDQLVADGADGIGHDEVGIVDLRQYLGIGRAAPHDHGFNLVHDGQVGQVLGNALLIADHEQSHKSSLPMSRQAVFRDSFSFTQASRIRV